MIPLAHIVRALDVAWEVLKDDTKRPTRESHAGHNIDDEKRYYRGLDLWNNTKLRDTIDRLLNRHRREIPNDEEKMRLHELLMEQSRRVEEGDWIHAGQSHQGKRNETHLDPNAWDKPARYRNKHPGFGEGLETVNNELDFSVIDGVLPEILTPNTDPYRTVYGPFGRGQEDDPDAPMLSRYRDFQDMNRGEPMDILDATWQILKIQ